MKLSTYTIFAALPVMAAAYNMGGYRFARPLYVRGVRCEPSTRGKSQCQPDPVDQAFQNLENQVTGNARGRRRRWKNEEEMLRQQQEWVNRAFGLASEVASKVNANKGEVRDEVLRQQQEWTNRAFAIANDVATGRTTPRYEVNDDNEAFSVALDVPGVKASDIDISVDEEEHVLMISGERKVGRGEDARVNKFSKSFSLDSSTQTEQLTARLGNGVLMITVPKEFKKKESTVRKVAIVEVTDDATPINEVRNKENEDPPVSEKDDVEKDDAEDETKPTKDE